MQDADGPPEQVDQWRLVIDDPERIVWRRAWLTGASNVRDADTERRYQEIEIVKNDLTGEFEVERTDNTPSETPGVAVFQTDSSSDVGESVSRQGAIKLAVDEMVTSTDIAGNVEETTAKEWVRQRRPEPDFTGRALTDFDASDAPDTPDQTVRERLVEETGGKNIVDGTEWPTMPERIGAWDYALKPDSFGDESRGAGFRFQYGTATTSDQPPRIVYVKQETFSGPNYAAYVAMPQVSGFGDSEPVVTADDKATMAERLVRYLNSNPPNQTDHPRWSDAVLDVSAVDEQWTLERFRVTTNKTKIEWEYTPDASDPDDCGPWTISYDGQPTTNDYIFKFLAGPNLEARVNEDSTSFQPESLDVVLPPRPSVNAVSSRAMVIAAKIADNPCDPWGHSEITHPDPTVDTLDARQVATFLSQADSDTVSESIESDPDMAFIYSKVAEMLREVARLDKTSMDRFQAAKINRLVTKLRRRLPTTTDSPTSNAIDDVAEAVVVGDDHPANHTDDALAAIQDLAAERGYDDVATSGLNEF